MIGNNFGHRNSKTHDSKPGMPKTLCELLGNGRLLVEYHKGITCYTPEEIWVRATYGEIRIQGTNLSLCCMRREQLCITGNIQNLELQRR